MMPASQALAAPSSPRSPNFDRVARLYRWAEYLLLGPLLTRTRGHFLAKLGDAQNALVLGDGDGRFVAQLLHRNPDMQATAIDVSAKMLHLLRTRSSFAGSRLRTLQLPASDAVQRLDLGGVDLIVTHFFLDCLSQPELDWLAQRLAQAVQPGCRWLLSDFGIPQRQPWRAFARGYVRLLYWAFRALTGLQPQTLPDIAGSLAAAGFKGIHHHARLNGLLYSELWQLPSR